MISSNNSRNLNRRRLSAGAFTGVLFAILPSLTLAGPLGPAVAWPDRETVVLEVDTPQDEQGVSVGPGSIGVDADADLDLNALAGEIREHIKRSRASGSPRPLGLAQGMLAKIPESQWSPTLYLLRATISQRLHQFDGARADLERVLAAEPNNGQALLTLYTIAMVQGDLALADQTCKRFGDLMPGLWAASCAAEVASYGSDPGLAFQRLELSLAEARNASSMETDWTLVTLADMATRLGLPSAGSYWEISLSRDPKDLYRRAQYADWLLAQDRPQKVLELTADYEAMDTLAVLRAIALTRLNHSDRNDLEARLDARFAEATWRGEILHQWERARFLLDVKGDAQGALAAAEANWETQRAHSDRRLLLRAAHAAGDEKTIRSLSITE